MINSATSGRNNLNVFVRPIFPYNLSTQCYSRRLILSSPCASIPHVPSFTQCLPGSLHYYPGQTRSIRALRGYSVVPQNHSPGGCSTDVWLRTPERQAYSRRAFRQVFRSVPASHYVSVPRTNTGHHSVTVTAYTLKAN